jgi:hypothetical protein
MQIREMRASIDQQNVRKGLPPLPDNAPDWVVKRMYEQRNNLPLTPLPAHIEQKRFKTLAEFRAWIAGGIKRTASADNGWAERRRKVEALAAELEKDAQQLDRLMRQARAAIASLQ